MEGKKCTCNSWKVLIQKYFYWVQSQAGWTLDTHANRQLRTIVPGFTMELHQRLLRPGTQALTKAQSATRHNRLGGCPEVEWWTNFTGKKKKWASSKVKKLLMKVIKCLDHILRPVLSNTFVLNVWGFFFCRKTILITRLHFYNHHRKTDCWWQTQIRLVKIISSTLPKIVAPGMVLVSRWKSKDLKSWEFRSAFVLNYKMVHCSLNE